MKLTSDQDKAIRKCIEWYFDTSWDKKNIFTIAGFAGTGKSTIINVLISILGLSKYNVLFTAFTGKAVNVLRRKGLIANTLHKTFYNIYKSSSGKFFFRLKARLSSSIKLIVIDEFSMLNDDFIRDILSFGIYTIALGDIGQLPPIIGRNSYLEDIKNIDAQLTQIIRQDETSGVLQLATLARNFEPIHPGAYNDSNVFFMKDIKNLLEYEVIICYKNETRQRFNKAIRIAKGIKSIYPEKGEKLICLKTNYFHQFDYEDIPILLVNGLSLVTLEESTTRGELLKIKYKPDFIPNDDYFFETYCNKNIFENYITGQKNYGSLKIENDDSPDSIVDLDFFYCGTAHKMQGSEFNNRGLIIVEKDIPSHIYSKWLYTAITRFKTCCDIIFYE